MGLLSKIKKAASSIDKKLGVQKAVRSAVIKATAGTPLANVGLAMTKMASNNVGGSIAKIAKAAAKDAPGLALMGLTGGTSAISGLALNAAKSVGGDLMSQAKAAATPATLAKLVASGGNVGGIGGAMPSAKPMPASVQEAAVAKIVGGSAAAMVAPADAKAAKRAAKAAKKAARKAEKAARRAARKR